MYGTFKAMTMVHSEESKGPQEIDITIERKNGKATITAETANGIKCTAIFNPFTGLYYADDIYGIIENFES